MLALMECDGCQATLSGDSAHELDDFGFWADDEQPRSYAEPDVRFGEDRLYFVEITDKREPIEFLRGTCFSFHLVSN